MAAAFAVHAAVAGSFSARLPALKHGLGIGDGRVGLALFVMAAATLVGTCAAPLVVRRVGSRDLVRTGTVLFCLAFVGPAVASSYAWFCASLAVLGGLGGLLDVGFNVQGIAVQRAYGRPILAGLHGVWSVALFAGGALGRRGGRGGNFACLAIRGRRGPARARERADARLATPAGG